MRDSRAGAGGGGGGSPARAMPVWCPGDGDDRGCPEEPEESRRGSQSPANAERAVGQHQEPCRARTAPLGERELRPLPNPGSPTQPSSSSPCQRFSP